MSHTPNGTIGVIDINKFAFQAFNCLLYDREISVSLVANMLLGLFKYYNLPRAIKKVNLRILYCKFSKAILETVDEEDVTDSFVQFSKSSNISNSFFNDYQFRGLKFEIYLFYDYQKTITLIAFTAKVDDNIFFA